MTRTEAARERLGSIGLKSKSRPKAARGAVLRIKAEVGMRNAVSLLCSVFCVLPSAFYLLILAACHSAPRTTMPSGGTTYFPQTGHTVQGPFGAYFQARGGAESFGYPITEEFLQHGLVVQYFEKVRMEYHPENPPRYRVQLGLLGETLGRREPPIPVSHAPLAFNRSHRYYPQTGHTLAQPFLAYYDAYGGLDRFGYPLSEPYRFPGALVQDFQRARLMSWEGEIQIADWGRMLLTAALDDDPLLDRYAGFVYTLDTLKPIQ